MANLLIIKDIIKAKRLSIREVAAQVGITEQGLQKLIRENSTKVETLESISRVLNVSVSTFFNEAGSENSPIENTNTASQQRTIETQAETINRQSKIIETLTNK